MKKQCSNILGIQYKLKMSLLSMYMLSYILATDDLTSSDGATNVSAIIGGTVGGFVLLILLITVATMMRFAILQYKKKKRYSTNNVLFTQVSHCIQNSSSSINYNSCYVLGIANVRTVGADSILAAQICKGMFSSSGYVRHNTVLKIFTYI